MALLSQKNVGGNTVSSSYANLREQQVEITAAYTTDILAVVGLPHIIFWASEHVPYTPGASSFAVKFQAATRTLNGEPDFENIMSTLVPTGGVPQLFSFEFPCLAIRATVSLPTGATSLKFDYVLSAYGP